VTVAPESDADPLGDAFFEAARGLWASAAESFERAAEQDPDDPLPVLGAAVALLQRGRIEAALLLLETTPILREDHTYLDRVRWLRAAARLRAGDVLGAERAARDLPPALRARVDSVCALRAGAWRAGVEALFRAHGPRRAR
jgi:thioredoxin-like negative regulator of GroEL